MKEINAEIIAIGTELLLGQIANTNAQWISDELSTYGINVYFHTVAGDNHTRVKNLFQLAQERSNLVIVTGGLGPTDDDMTREAFQELSGLSLYEHKRSIEKIEHYFNNHNRVMTPNNRKQALVFEGSKVLFNETGMAPGMIIEYNDVQWVFLPGVPREMKHMFKHKVAPYLFELTGKKEVILSRTLRFIGIGEAELEHRLFELIKNQSNTTIAPLAQDSGVALRLTVKEKSEAIAEKLLDDTEERIFQEVGTYCYGTDETTLEQVVVDLLKKKGMTISSAESITGGLFASEIIRASGASTVFPGSIVSYQTQVKQDILGVSKETIQSYGVVSEPCAKEMAQKIKEQFHTDIGISFTGVAGPDSLENQEIGTVYIGIATQEETAVKSFRFNGNRNEIRKRAVLKGLELIFKMLK